MFYYTCPLTHYEIKSKMECLVVLVISRYDHFVLVFLSPVNACSSSPVMLVFVACDKSSPIKTTMSSRLMFLILNVMFFIFMVL